MTADIEELMHKVLDGEASTAETEGLENLLRGDPAMRARFDAHSALHDRLAGVRPLDPPADLMDEVLARVTPMAARRPSIAPMVRYAASFVAGIAIGAALLELASTEVDPARVSGTLIPVSGSGPASTVVAEWRDGVLVLDVKLDPNSGAATVLELRADGTLIHQSAPLPGG